MARHVYRFKSTVWKYPGMAGWHFVSVDTTTSAKIRKTQEGVARRGWGSIPVTVTIGKSTWKTSIFPDKDKTFLLPLKAKVRTSEGIYEDDNVSILLALS